MILNIKRGKMKFSFFEEYPTTKNLEKLKLLSFNTVLYIAAPSLRRFRKLETEIKKKYKHVTSLVYWPILTDSEGYWMSPFSSHNGLQRIIDDLKTNRKPLTVLWDAELPMLNKKLFIQNLPSFFSNKKLILQFLKDAKHYNIHIETAEYETENKTAVEIMKFFCLTFDQKNYPHMKIGMLYTSMIASEIVEDYLLNGLETARLRYKSFKVGLGCIGAGKCLNEPQLFPQHLKRDLVILNLEKIQDIVIFRLGGITKEHVKVLEEFV